MSETVEGTASDSPDAGGAISDAPLAEGVVRDEIGAPSVPDVPFDATLTPA